MRCAHVARCGHTSKDTSTTVTLRLRPSLRQSQRPAHRPPLCPTRRSTWTWHMPCVGLATLGRTPTRLRGARLRSGECAPCNRRGPPHSDRRKVVHARARAVRGGITQRPFSGQGREAKEREAAQAVESILQTSTFLQPCMRIHAAQANGCAQSHGRCRWCKRLIYVLHYVGMAPLRRRRPLRASAASTAAAIPSAASSPKRVARRVPWCATSTSA